MSFLLLEVKLCFISRMSIVGSLRHVLQAFPLVARVAIGGVEVQGVRGRSQESYQSFRFVGEFGCCGCRVPVVSENASVATATATRTGTLDPAAVNAFIQFLEVFRNNNVELLIISSYTREEGGKRGAGSKETSCGCSTACGHLSYHAHIADANAKDRDRVSYDATLEALRNEAIKCAKSVARPNRDMRLMAQAGLNDLGIPYVVARQEVDPQAVYLARHFRKLTTTMCTCIRKTAIYCSFRHSTPPCNPIGRCKRLDFACRRHSAGTGWAEHPAEKPERA